jgi:ribonuclease P protein subunit RPR2
MIDLLVCDDSDEARAALRTVFADHDEITIVGEAADGEEAVALALALAPDVVLIDLQMPIADGIEATRRIAELLPAARIVALSVSNDRESIEAMTAAGAAAYCVKGAPLRELERAITGSTEPLARLARDLTRATSRSGVGTLVAGELRELAGGSAVAVYVASETGLSLIGFAGSGAAARAAAAPGIALRAFAGSAVARSDDADLCELAVTGLHCSSALAMPLTADGVALGALLLTMPVDDDRVADDALVADLAALAGPALAAERRLAFTHAEARRDAVTGLPNRRALDERLDEALRRAAVAGEELSVVVFDTRGRAAGHDVLEQVARAALRVLRAGEELYRSGEDEFAVVVAGGGAAAARVVARIEGALAARGRGVRLPDIAAGIAVFPDDATTSTDLHRAAAAALHASKRRVPSPASSIRARGGPSAGRREPAVHLAAAGSPQARVLLVDDDPGLLALLRATFELAQVDLEEARTAAAAVSAIAARSPDVVVLDIGLPDMSGLELCRRLKDDPQTRWIGVVLLTGAGPEAERPGRAAGADAIVHKPFSPLELLSVVERLAGGQGELPFTSAAAGAADEQLLLYANDLRRLLELERGRREQLQRTHRQTVAALAGALESKDVGTGSHSQRVQRYAIELAQAIEPNLLLDPSVEYGFLLHDVGKIGIPDHILQKPGPLDDEELRLMRTHTLLGEQLLGDVDLLQGEGLNVVRWHHERWDGGGYPDGLARTEIPLAARIFALADALDAMTSERPYRSARNWQEASAELRAERGHQFDPDVVDAFRGHELALRGIQRGLTAA